MAEMALLHFAGKNIFPGEARLGVMAAREVLSKPL